jgi:hypothetical protein
MKKLVTLILRPKYSHKKQIIIDYEAQFSTDPVLNDKIEKNQLNKRHKKQPELTRVNLLSIILMS